MAPPRAPVSLATPQAIAQLATRQRRLAAVEEAIYQVKNRRARIAELPIRLNNKIARWRRRGSAMQRDGAIGAGIQRASRRSKCSSSDASGLDTDIGVQQARERERRPGDYPAVRR